MADNIQELFALAERYHEEFARNVDEVFSRLELLDPVLGKFALEVLEDRSEAALWIISPNMTLGGKSPLRMLADGRRQDVLDVLGRIEHGLF